MYEMIHLLMTTLGRISVPESPYMELCMELVNVGSTSIMVATDLERELANEPGVRPDLSKYNY